MTWSSCARYRASILLLLLLSFTSAAPAAIVTFDNGGVGTNWNEPLNWNPNGTPQGNDSANINANHLVTIDATGPTARRLDVYGGGSLRIDGGDLNVRNGQVTIGNGTYGDVLQLGGTFTAGVDMVIGDLGSYYMSGGALSVGRNLTIATGGVFTIGDTAATIDIQRDLVLQTDSVFEVYLVGTTVPTINIGRFLDVTDAILVVDTSLWMGSSAIDLFQATNGITGSFQAVFVDNVEIVDYSLTSSGIALVVPEPNSLWLGLTALLGTTALTRGRRGESVRLDG